MGTLGAAEAQRTGQAFQKRRRNPDVASLFEPRVPGEADACENCHVFPSQAAAATVACRRQSDLRRRQARPAGLEEVGKFLALSVGHLDSSEPVTASASTICPLLAAREPRQDFGS